MKSKDFIEQVKVDKLTLKELYELDNLNIILKQDFDVSKLHDIMKEDGFIFT